MKITKKIKNSRFFMEPGIAEISAGYSRKVSECTYARIPIPKYSPRSLAAKDYEDLVTEYIAELNISGGEE